MTQRPDALLTGDCLDVLPTLADASVDLVYLDPPFNTGQTRTAAAGRYRDAFGDGYADYLRPRLQALQRVLKPCGSLFFHCDWRASHIVRAVLEDVFGANNFVNEIIWRYGLGASRPGRKLLSKHDTIFWFAAGPDYTFNLIRTEPTAAMLAKYRHIDEHGQRYMYSYGKKYVMKGGKPLDDVWEIPAIAATSGERVGYPTQKPLALLTRIVTLASNPGDTVLDPFCGSGTTLLAAQQLGRCWIGIDQNTEAVTVTRQRLNTL
jgi:site-specific DNA-methyltransferase (adenine-specific)